MRLMTITKLFAVSVVLMSGTAAFAAREVNHGASDICTEQNSEFCRPSPFAVPGANIDSHVRTHGDTQARANARADTWPGDMILN